MADLQEERKLTYMFITHNLSVVKHISDDILVMYCGCVVEKARTAQLFSNPLHPYTRGLLSAIPVPSLRTARKKLLMTGEITSPINPSPGCRFASRCPYATEQCRAEMPALCEVEPGHIVACHNLEQARAAQ